MTGLADPPRILRCELPVDDQVHGLPTLAAQVVHVDCRRPSADVVELWFREDDVVRTDRYLVTGTGQRAPAGSMYVGTALSPATSTTWDGVRERGALVWHVWVLPS